MTNMGGLPVIAGGSPIPVTAPYSAASRAIGLFGWVVQLA